MDESKRRNRLVAGVVVAIALLLGVGGVAIGGESAQRAPVSTPPPAEKAKSQPQAAVDIARAAARARCKLNCVKRKLNQLIGAHNALANDYYNCETLVPITSYDGYEYDDGAGGTVITSALDFTDSGDFPDELAVVYVC